MISDAMLCRRNHEDETPAPAEDDQVALLPAENVQMRDLSDTDSMSDRSLIFVYDAPWTASYEHVESAISC